MAINNYVLLKKVLRDKNYFIERYENSNGYYPLDIELRLNWECNAKCVMCGVADYFSKDEKINKITDQEIRRLLLELKEMGCANITLSGGEPTLRKDLIPIITFASQTCGFNVSINTNGFLLSESFLKQIILAGINSITFSLDSPLEEVHDHIRGLKGSYRKIVDAIDFINNVSKMNSRRNIFVYVNCVILKSNVPSLVNFIEFYEKHPFDHLNFSPASINTSWDNWTANKEELRPSVDDVKYLKNIIKTLNEEIEELQIEDPFGDTEEEITNNLHVIFSNRPTTCFVPMLHSVIQCNGDVIPCCYSPDTFVMGNVKDTSFEEIWNGDSYKQFRSQCHQLKFPMCASCKQYELLNTNLNKNIIGGFCK